MPRATFASVMREVSASPIARDSWTDPATFRPGLPVRVLPLVGTWLVRHLARRCTQTLAGPVGAAAGIPRAGWFAAPATAHGGSPGPVKGLPASRAGGVD